MVPYFGTPISGGNSSAAVTALKGAHGFVSYAHPQQLELCAELCQSFAVDNGAYSFWRSGKTTDWEGFYKWVGGIKNYPNFDFAIIPDVIGGTEEENDRLVDDWPYPWIGVPVWHMHESIERLVNLARFPRIAIGGSCEFKSVGSTIWWKRAEEAFGAICDGDGLPTTKVHGLRMLDPKIVEALPLSSADSTSLGRNIAIDKSWTGSYKPLTKEGRAYALRQRTEFFNSPKTFNPLRGLI